MVDCRGYAPRSPACKAGDLLNDRAAREKEMVAEARIELARGRLMRPLPSHLATPQLKEKMARRLSAALSGARFGIQPAC